MIGRHPGTSARPLTWGNSAATRLRTVLACAWAGLLLVACTGPDGDPSPDPTSPTPSATASNPAPSTSAPPARPAAMQRQDVEGAIAAAQYFLELYPYAYNTGDLTEWRAMSHPDCIFCASVIDNVEELHAAGGYQSGGSVTWEWAEGAEADVPDTYVVDLGAVQRTTYETRLETTEISEGGPARLLIRLEVASPWAVLGVNVNPEEG